MERVEHVQNGACEICGLVPIAPRLHGTTHVVAKSSAMHAVLRRVARFAGALGMRVLGYDKYLSADEVRSRGAEPAASP